MKIPTFVVAVVVCVFLTFVPNPPGRLFRFFYRFRTTNLRVAPFPAENRSCNSDSISIFSNLVFFFDVHVEIYRVTHVVSLTRFFVTHNSVMFLGKFRVLRSLIKKTIFVSSLNCGKSLIYLPADWVLLSVFYYFYLRMQ